jgi:hypothetical protein
MGTYKSTSGRLCPGLVKNHKRAVSFKGPSTMALPLSWLPDTVKPGLSRGQLGLLINSVLSNYSMETRF